MNDLLGLIVGLVLSISSLVILLKIGFDWVRR